ncbi:MULTISPECIES: UbiA family prenyltransferase [unclassified Nocardia]|uniref:UbiA family prenyltransferase n=1 Tax=unclassified Nocardia TaxID=2637762 RepID=UPI001CE45589|nr:MULTISPECIES: UbiA family prenyltransferase [unclassified Nocardia]
MVSIGSTRNWLAHMETCRPYTLAYPGLTGLAGAALTGAPTPAQWVTAWLAPTLVWTGGLYLGDYFDRELDGVGKPHRPIPSGRLTPRTAVLTGICCVAAAFAVSALVEPRAVAIALAGAAGTVGYSRVLKRHGILGNLARGALTGLVLIFAATLVHGWPAPLVLGWAAVFCLQDTGSNIVGTVRDIAGDRACGYRTVSVVYGGVFANRCAAACFAVAVLGALALHGISADLGSGLLLAAICLGIRAYGPVLGSGPIDPRKALRTHEILVAERLVLAAAVAANGLGGPATLGILAAALAISLSTQLLLRGRHEFGNGTVELA